MNTWALLILAATTGSMVSLLGGVYLIYAKKGVRTIQRLAVPFAAGALLGAAFLSLLPEALDADDSRTVLTATLAGLLAFFVLERSLSWFHHHHEESHDDVEQALGRRNTSLIVIGDTLHNLIDGLAIGAAFLVSPATGLVTIAAIAAHEIPQEIGDFSLLLAKGMHRKKVLIVNVLSAVATVIGASIVYGLGGSLPFSESVLLGITAGFFIYIAASDIIPTIHAEPRRKVAATQSLFLFAGVGFVALSETIIHTLVG